MKATGIVRRIDDLGRIVVPKEIRRTMRIREGDPLEIYVNDEGSIMLKKYSPIGELGDFAAQYADTLSKTAGFPVCITDKDSIIAVSGAPKKELWEKRISGDMERIINDKTTFLAKNSDSGKASVAEGIEKYYAGVVVPIISDGDSIGSVVMVSNEGAAQMGEGETKLAQSAAGFLGKQMEE